MTRKTVIAAVTGLIAMALIIVGLIGIPSVSAGQIDSNQDVSLSILRDDA